MKNIDNGVQTNQYADLLEIMKGAVSDASLKKRLAQWYREGKTGYYDLIVDLFDSLNKSTVQSLKKRLAKWHREGKIDEFDGADVLDSLNKSKVQYTLRNFAVVFGVSTLAPPGSFIVLSPARFLYTLGSRIYLEAKRDRERAKIHGLDVAIFGAIPIFGRLNYIIPLYRENRNLYALAKEQMTEFILSFKLRGKKG